MRENKFNSYFIQYYGTPMEYIAGLTLSELLLGVSIALGFFFLALILLGIKIAPFVTIIACLIIFFILKINRQKRTLLPKGYIRHFIYKKGVGKCCGIKKGYKITF